MKCKNHKKLTIFSNIWCHLSFENAKIEIVHSIEKDFSKKQLISGKFLINLPLSNVYGIFMIVNEKKSLITFCSGQLQFFRIEKPGLTLDIEVD